MFFTKDDYLKIENWLKSRAVKDSDFKVINSIYETSDNNYLVILQDNENKRIKIDNFLSDIISQDLGNALNKTISQKGITDSLTELTINIPVERGAGVDSVIQKGGSNNASGDYSFAEGISTKATGNTAHSEGNSTTASGENSHAEGLNTTASGDNSHTEGYRSVASGLNSHAEGYYTEAQSNQSHAEGYYTVAHSDVNIEPCHAEGVYTQALSRGAHAEGGGVADNPNIASGMYSHVEGRICDAEGHSSHAEGHATLASGKYSHSQNDSTIAEGESSHAEGINTKAKGKASHAQGQGTQNIMVPAGNHTSLGEKYEGGSAIGESSSVSGVDCAAIGNASFANGYRSVAYGGNSFANGQDVTTNNGSEAAFGRNNYSHKNSTTWGDALNTVFSIGVSSNFNDKINALEIMQNGDVYVNSIGDYDGTNPQTAQSIQTVLSNITSSLNNKVNQDTYDMDKESLEMRIGDVETLAYGSQRALAFDNYSTLIQFLNPGLSSGNILNLGQNLYIKQLNVPDLWISAFRAPDELTEYTYTTDEAFLEYIKNGGWVGCYQLSQLETLKVDLTNYVEKSEVTALETRIAELENIIQQITKTE